MCTVAMNELLTGSCSQGNLHQLSSSEDLLLSEFDFEQTADLLSVSS